MNKEQAKERLCAIETEVEKLRRIIDEPEQRKPEEGDVWENHGGNLYILTNRDSNTLLNTEYSGESFTYCHAKIAECGTYLGKFDEVFVKISDVREALSIKDKEGDDTIGLLQSFDRNQWGACSTLNALRKLNIITD